MPSLESIRFAQARDTADAASPQRAARCAWARLDDLAAEAPTRARWDCRAGCAACCRLQVFVDPAEADAIAAVLRAEPSGPAREALCSRIDETARLGAALDAGGWRRARLPCAFLDPDERCRIYAVRPVKCRAHVSRDVGACEDPASPVPLDDWLVQAAEAVLHGLADDRPREELHAALARRLRASGEIGWGLSENPAVGPRPSEGPPGKAP